MSSSLRLSRSPSFSRSFSSSSQWRTFRNCSDVHSLNLFLISDRAWRHTTSNFSEFPMETNTCQVLFLILLYLTLFPINVSSTMMSNDPFDIRFVSYNGMSMWESTPFVFLFLSLSLSIGFTRQTKSTIEYAHTQVYVRSVAFERE